MLKNNSLIQSCSKVLIYSSILVENLLFMLDTSLSDLPGSPLLYIHSHSSHLYKKINYIIIVETRKERTHLNPFFGRQWWDCSAMITTILLMNKIIHKSRQRRRCIFLYKFSIHNKWLFSFILLSIYHVFLSSCLIKKKKSNILNKYFSINWNKLAGHKNGVHGPHQVVHGWIV